MRRGYVHWNPHCPLGYAWRMGGLRMVLGVLYARLRRVS